MVGCDHVVEYVDFEAGEHLTQFLEVCFPGDGVFKEELPVKATVGDVIA